MNNDPLVCPVCESEVPEGSIGGACERSGTDFESYPPVRRSTLNPVEAVNAPEAVAPAPLPEVVVCVHCHSPASGEICGNLPCQRNPRGSEIRLPWGSTFLQPKRPVHIGRRNSPFSSQLDQHTSVSKDHLLLQWCEPHPDTGVLGIELFDVGSTNGTWLNGKRITPRDWSFAASGSRITLGRNEELGISLEVGNA